MFVLERLISRSSRSLGAMLGTSRRGAGHAQGCREGSGDDDPELQSGPVYSPAQSCSAQIVPRAPQQQNRLNFPADPERRALRARSGVALASLSRKENRHG